jgi:hypothetical protein
VIYPLLAQLRVAPRGNPFNAMGFPDWRPYRYLR